MSIYLRAPYRFKLVNRTINKPEVNKQLSGSVPRVHISDAEPAKSEDDSDESEIAKTEFPTTTSRVHLMILSSKILLRQCDNQDPIVATMVTMTTTATMENLERKT